MVAITIGLILMSAVVSVFVGSRTAYQSTSGLGALADGGRTALSLIGESARSAGFLACNSAQSATNNTLVVLSNITDNFGLGTEGYEATGTGTAGVIALPARPVVPTGVANWVGGLDPLVPGAAPGPGNIGLPVQGSDVLVLRSSVQRVPPPQQTMAYTTLDANPNDTQVTVSPVPAITAGQYAVVSDCTKSVIFQATGVGGAAPSAVTFGGALPVGFSAGALVSPLTTSVYYIGVGSDGDASLWRLEQINGPGFTAEELVPDIENMQVLYGIDGAGTQTASAYVTADKVGTLNVVSLQVAVLAASPPGGNPVQALTYNLLGTTITAPADNRMRHVFSATINLRNAVN
jgi:type IV pilus assembly protein PilW